MLLTISVSQEQKIFWRQKDSLLFSPLTPTPIHKTMASKLETQAAATTVAIAATAAFATYFLTARHYNSKIVTKRSEEYQRDRAEADEIKAKREVAGLPSGVKLE